MAQVNDYVDLKGVSYFLKELDDGQQKLICQLQNYAKKHPDSAGFGNYWMPKVSEFYAARGLTQEEIIRTMVWRIAQDLGSRLAIAEGWTRPGDYRDELEHLIGTRFSTRREFCRAAGLSEDMLSHVLAKRKHLAIDTLTDALERVGYTVHIAPAPEIDL